VTQSAIARIERTIIRHISVEDAPFFLELLNFKPWQKYIGTCGFLKKPHLQYPDFGFA